MRRRGGANSRRQSRGRRRCWLSLARDDSLVPDAHAVVADVVGNAVWRVTGAASKTAGETTNAHSPG